MKIVKEILLLIVIGLLFFSAKAVSGQSVEELQKQIDTYTQELVRLSAQSNTLSNQIAQFDAQIRLTTLRISQTEEKISLLGGRIDQLEGSLDALSTAFSSRAVETYKMARVGDPFLIVVSAPDLNEAISRFHYLQRIQEADRDLLQRLQAAQQNYKVEKTDQEELQAELKKQKENLNSQKIAKANLLAATKNDEKKYQQLLAEARAQLSAFQRFVTSQGGASILSNQTKCDSWGCYYNQRDSQWGNMSIGLSGIRMADAGCLVSSVAMVAKHYGKNITPADIAASPAPFFSNTALMLQSWSNNGVSVSRSGRNPSTETIDSEINAGRPVIVGLYGSYSYPEHFIVIKSKDSRGYIMNDPFLENGGDKPLTDKYSISNIVRVDLVSVN